MAEAPCEPPLKPSPTCGGPSGGDMGAILIVAAVVFGITVGSLLVGSGKM